MVMSKKNYCSILKRIEEKKRKLGLLEPFNEDLSYPSCDDGMGFIDKSAIEYIKHMANMTKRRKLSWDDIKDINRRLDDECTGEFRTRNVRVKTNAGYNRVCTFRQMVYFRDNFIQWLKISQGNIIEIAAIAHVRLVFLHPFDDGNGRTAHLLMNLILLQGGYPVTGIDNPDRYLELLRKISISEKRLDIFNPNLCDELLSGFCSFVYEMVEKTLDLHLAS